MTEAENGPITPDAPRPPGTPDVDLDVDVPGTDREEPENQDVEGDAGEPEPPG
ncbi:hypothetical protein [Amycolatopsis australiensis]|uniref:Uncharacterized protein n=1 Tax=Amycolatopsis australiensis TaxID=546364 RepID=A0A1K1REM5_9PSEU|nr:hypothetical protein [Amycolatopsis australiensis]SFW70623.1 hypothetical protein SAMN04489730_3143 [Amycolatopsis australiensis]